MNPLAMVPFGKSLRAYFEGDTAAELIIHRDDGRESPLPVGVFFRNPSAFSPIETAAIESCSGRVLDVGAGTGMHSLALSQKGLTVTAIDINETAVDIMKRRGLTDVTCTDIFEYSNGRFDTLLLLGHGIGMVETIAGLDRLLSHARGMVSEKGQVLLDSLDVRVTDDPRDLAYHETNRLAGRYIGEIRMHFEVQGERGPECGWLQVDDETLRARAETSGWQCAIVRREETGDYLARLTQ